MSNYPVVSLHHVTATVDRAQADLDFCVALLGMRLLKRTVNFDNHHVYHFYYGDERGTPGTIWTTFPYHGRGVRVGTKGAGQIVATSFSIPEASLDFWKGRLRDSGTDFQDGSSRFGERSIVVPDPSGLSIELIETARDIRAPWTEGGIGLEAAIRGLHSVSMAVRTRGPSLQFLTGVLGFTIVGEAGDRTRAAINDAPGTTIDIIEAPDAPPAVNGLGTVHHVALAIDGEDEQARLRHELIDRGCQVTEILDRQYFRSIYFREPGGVLFEVATVAPGFTIDETLPCLGQALKLPPWEEPHRAEIEAGLPPIVPRHARTPGTGWV